MTNTRKITIESRGPIAQKSGIHGPVTVPYLEDVRVIARMIVGRVSVVEHLTDGATRKLTVKDIPELTAEAPKVIPQNKLVKQEKTELEQLVKAQQEKALVETQEKLEKAQAEKAATQEPIVQEPVVAPVTPEAPKEEASEANNGSLSKKERKALAAAQQRQEELVEKK